MPNIQMTKTILTDVELDFVTGGGLCQTYVLKKKAIMYDPFGTSRCICRVRTVNTNVAATARGTAIENSAKKDSHVDANDGALCSCRRVKKQSEHGGTVT